MALKGEVLDEKKTDKRYFFVIIQAQENRKRLFKMSG